MFSAGAVVVARQRLLLRKLTILVLLSVAAAAAVSAKDESSTTSSNSYGIRRGDQEHLQQQQQRLSESWMTTEGRARGTAASATCEDVRDVQSAVIRILNAHYEYDKGIDALHDQMEALKKDLASLRSTVETFVNDASNRPRYSLLAKHSASSGKPSSAPEVSSSGSWGHGVPLILPQSPIPSFSVRLDNLTFIVDGHQHRLDQLDKRLRRLRCTSLSHASGSAPVGHGYLKRPQSGHGAEREKEREEEKEKERKRLEDTEREKKRETEREKEKELEKEREKQRERENLILTKCERDFAVARELANKQRDINAHVQRKMQQLEQMLDDKLKRIQKDAPYHYPESSSRMLNGNCQSGFVRYLSSCYVFVNATANWIEAEKKCQALNPDSHLVTIDTRDEEEFILRYRSYNDVRWSSRYVWIGANDMAMEGRWTWVASGSEVTYSNWRTGEPSNYGGDQHCAYLQATEPNGGKTASSWNSGGSGSGKWDDWHCHSIRINFVCEIVVK